MADYGVHVFVNGRKVALQSNTIVASRLLETAGFAGPHWDLYRPRGETDPSGGSLVSCNETLRVIDGDWFRAAEGHRTCA